MLDDACFYLDNYFHYYTFVIPTIILHWRNIITLLSDMDLVGSDYYLLYSNCQIIV